MNKEVWQVQYEIAIEHLGMSETEAAKFADEQEIDVRARLADEFKDRSKYDVSI